MSDLLTELTSACTGLLSELIAVPSFSGEEQAAAAVLTDFLSSRGLACQHIGNNLIVRQDNFHPDRPTLLLNSHLDTVRPQSGWRHDPFTPTLEDGRLYGLGSNDAGGPLVSLLAVFLYFNEKKNLPWNVIFAATAEEEISGENGITAVLPELGQIDLAIVGEPTGMRLAIAERGLMVLDCVAHGRSGHAARDEGDNAITHALRDIEWFHNYSFAQVSPFLGPVKMTVTMIEAGTQHNVVPEQCRFVVDVRTTEAYSHEQVLETIRRHVRSEVRPRSVRLRPSGLEESHPFVQAAKKLGIPLFGSATLSDQALLPMPSVKIGPGDSARSHTADEYIELEEIRQGVRLYCALLDTFFAADDA